MYLLNDNEYLQHYGIKNQKWGERRFQNKDGSLTPAGKQRYYSDGEYKYDPGSMAGQAGNIVDALDTLGKQAAGIGSSIHDKDKKATYEQLAELYDENSEAGKAKKQLKDNSKYLASNISAKVSTAVGVVKTIKDTPLSEANAIGKKALKDAGSDFVDNWKTGMKSIKGLFSK